MSTSRTGRIHLDEAYSKTEAMQRLGISQKFWDKMLDEGLPYTVVGHTRWVTGRDVLDYLQRNAERKPDRGLGTDRKDLPCRDIPK